MWGWVGTLASPWVRGVSGQEQNEGDASVPTPLNPTPAPTDTPRPFSKNLPVKGKPLPYDEAVREARIG